MSINKFDTRAIWIGVACALVALPFAIELGALAVKVDVLRAIFSESKWFTFKAVVGVVELLAFGLGAMTSHGRQNR